MAPGNGGRRRSWPPGLACVLLAWHLFSGQSQTLVPNHSATANASPRLPEVGVDYYPEQWPADQLKQDLMAIRYDLGADIVRVGEFLWGELEPADGVFNFTLLDDVILAAEELGLRLVLGTPTATMPAWLYQAHADEVVARAPDSGEGYTGASPGFGGRRQYSFNSQVYLRYAMRIVEQLAKRYGQRQSIAYWQVDNELGHEGSDLDFSPMALAAWRNWLESHYSSNIHTLNQAWGTRFWSATYGSFREVGLPTFTYPGGGQQGFENFRSNLSPGMLLDYRRFRRDSVTAFAKAQVDILRAYYVRGEITSNAPGGFWAKAMDHDDLFGHMDLAAYDNYPVWGGSLGAPLPSSVALTLDTVRGWGRDPSKGWMVAEQLIGAQGHDIIGYTPRPNQAVAWSAATFMHGATTLLFFRYRAAAYGQEEFCFGVLDHSTPVGSGRKWDEAKTVFQLAKAHPNLWMSPPSSRIALIYDTDNIFSWQAQPQSTAFDFTTEALRLYHPFWRNGAGIDVLAAPRFWQDRVHIFDYPTPRGAGAALLAQFSVILLPVPMILPGARLFPSESSPEVTLIPSPGSLLHALVVSTSNCSSKPSIVTTCHLHSCPNCRLSLAFSPIFSKITESQAQREAEQSSDALVAVLEEFVLAGGSLWLSFRSDIKDSANQMRRKPSRLARLAGVQVAEIESLNQPLTVEVTLASNTSTVTTASVFREGLSPGDGVQSIWSYTDSFFGDMGLAAVTRRQLGKGEVVYVGAGVDGEDLLPTATETLERSKVPHVGASESQWVEEALREDLHGKLWRLAINHGGEAAATSQGKTLQPYEVVVEAWA